MLSDIKFDNHDQIYLTWEALEILEDNKEIIIFNKLYGVKTDEIRQIKFMYKHKAFQYRYSYRLQRKDLKEKPNMFISEE